MAQVPQYDRQVAPQLTPMPYNNVNLNEDMFGVNISKEMGNIGKGLGNVGDALIEIKNKYDDTKIIEMINNGNGWEQENLHDKEKGYLYKLGKDAYGKSEELLKNYDDYMTKYIQNAHFSPAAKKRAQYAYLKARERVQETITTHDYKQGKFYTAIKDDDAKIKEALNELGLNKGKQKSVFNEIRYMVRELEAKRGRKITDNELMNLTNSLGYKGEKGVKIYKNLEKGLAARAGFIRDVMSDFLQYQNKHNGELSPDEL